MSWMKDNLQTICDNAIDIRGLGVRHEVKPMSNYYDNAIHDAINMLTTLIYSESNGDKLSDVFNKGEVVREASNAIQVLNDFQYFVSSIDSNLVAAND